MESIKCAVVGDTNVGKTCLLATWCTDAFPKMDFEKKHTKESTGQTDIFNNYSSYVEAGGSKLQVNCCDMRGSEEYDHLRWSMYPQTDIIIICFSLVSSTSLGNVREKWYPEVEQYCSGVPFILIGTKMDLRDDQLCLQQNKISKSEGHTMATEIGAATYLECSALQRVGVINVFHEAVCSVLNYAHEQNDFCTIL